MYGAFFQKIGMARMVATLSDDEPMSIARTLPRCLVPSTDCSGTRPCAEVFVGYARLSSAFRKVGHPACLMGVKISMKPLHA